MNATLAGWQKFTLHFFGFGIPCGFVVWYGGWSGLAVLVAWRCYDEYLDYTENRDTLAKALIDVLSQVSMTAIILVIRGFV